VSVRSFARDGLRGEAATDATPIEPGELAHRLLDPAVALRTLHWGRNYLYLARVEGREGPLEVVVKQFREPRWRLRIRGSKAARSFRAAQALAAAGFATPEPLLYAEPERGKGASIYVCRHLPDRLEARYLLRARNAGREREEFPEIDFEAFLTAAARLARRLHDAGFWHRDYSAGNLLMELAVDGGRPAAERCELALVDLNRCRVGRRVSLVERLRDLARLPLERAEDRARLLARYFAPEDSPSALARALYALAFHGFHGRHRWKRRLRGTLATLRSWLVPRGAHAHIPPPPPGAPARERIVWDELSDQPHSHAGRLARTRIRLADAGDHLRTFAALAGALPRIRAGYRRLAAERNRSPFPWPGVGVALRPWPGDPDALLETFFALGVSQALLRLHPWEQKRDDEERLARALAKAGVELTFTLPQSRELVRDLARWREAIAEIAERFVPLGTRFQIGQAINRSKWGIWRYGDYLELAAEAAEILRARGAVELAGPAVIDFEAHVTAAVVNRRQPGLRFDALASLLYVDRRGAPENRQLGFDTVDKVTLLAAIAETSRLVGTRRHWITEVNWPLREGPHSPAGRKVAVDETTQADYLARFYLLALATGQVERIFWWQLVARGYGLVDPEPRGDLRRRPAFHALATLARAIPAGARCLGPLPAPADTRLVGFEIAAGKRLVAAWSLGGTRRARLPSRPRRAQAQTGRELSVPSTDEVELTPDVRYFLL
jgi:hypothetical protein